MAGRSGTSRTYEERVERGQPNRTFSLPSDTDEEITALAQALKISRSKVVVRAVELLSQTVAPKSDATVD